MNFSSSSYATFYLNNEFRDNKLTALNTLEKKVLEQVLEAIHQSRSLNTNGGWS